MIETKITSFEQGEYKGFNIGDIVRPEKVKGGIDHSEWRLIIKEFSKDGIMAYVTMVNNPKFFGAFRLDGLEKVNE